MANDQDSGGEFRPFIAGTFKPGQYIQAGGQTSTPYLRGVQDLAYNHNTLVANVQHALVVQHANDTFAAITYTAPTVVSFAKYVVFVPSSLGRTTLTIKVVAGCSTATYAVRGVTGAATGAMSTPVATGVESTCTVTVGSGAFRLLTLDFELSGNGTFTPQAVYVTLAPYGSTTLSFTADTNVVPQDIVQYGVDRPLAVTMLRDLIRTNDHLYTDNVRCIQNWSYWGDWASVPTADTGLNAPANGQNVKHVVSQLYYKPRQGVKQVTVFAAGRTKAYPTTTEGVYFRFEGQDWTGGTFATTTTVTAEGSWGVWETNIQIPQDVADVPQYIQMACTSNSVAGKAYIQALAIYEQPAGIL